MHMAKYRPLDPGSTRTVQDVQVDAFKMQELARPGTMNNGTTEGISETKADKQQQVSNTQACCCLTTVTCDMPTRSDCNSLVQGRNHAFKYILPQKLKNEVSGGTWPCVPPGTLLGTKRTRGKNGYTIPASSIPHFVATCKQLLFLTHDWNACVLYTQHTLNLNVHTIIY